MQTQENKKFEKINFILPFISGILTSLSFYTTKLDFLIWFSLIPLFYTLFNNKIHPLKGFLITFIYSFTFYLGLLTWLFRLHPLTWVGFTENQSILILIFGWISFSLIESITLSILGWLYAIVKPEGYKKIIFVSSLWIIIEFLQGLTTFGFTWGRLAISQYKELYFIQSASIFGSLFISFLIILVNSSISLTIIEYFKEKSISKLKYMYPITILFLLNFFYGIYTISTKNDSGKEINIGIIQGNVLSDKKWKSPPQESLNTYFELTQKAINENKDKKLDFWVWPETAIVSNLNDNFILDQVKNFNKKNNIYLLTGIFDNKINEKNESESFNTMIGLSPNGDILGKYYKRHLVPFGEYQPLKKIIDVIYPSLSKMNALKHDVTPGKDSSVFKTPFGNIGGLICYESIFPELIRKSTNDGAELLVLVTNDSWYKDSAAVYHHNGQAVFRSIENGRYMVRAANTGISSFITPNGFITQTLAPLTEGYIIDKVKFLNIKTIYSKTGDILVIICLFLILLNLKKKIPTENN